MIDRTIDILQVVTGAGATLAAITLSDDFFRAVVGVAGFVYVVSQCFDTWRKWRRRNHADVSAIFHEQWGARLTQVQQEHGTIIRLIDQQTGSLLKLVDTQASMMSALRELAIELKNDRANAAAWHRDLLEAVRETRRSE